MKVYQKGFNDHINGVYVVITNDEIKIINGRYGLITLAEMYFHKIHINVNEMKIVMMNKSICSGAICIHSPICIIIESATINL